MEFLHEKMVHLRNKSQQRRYIEYFFGYIREPFINVRKQIILSFVMLYK